MIIDTHAHLNFNAYRDDLDEVIKRTQKENVWVVNIGSKLENSKKAVEIAKKYEGMFATVGLHPVHLAGGFFKMKKDIHEEEGGEEKADDFDMKKYKEIALSALGKVVAVGEIGLDYYYRPKTKIKTELFKQKQKEFFIKQLDLAKELNLPVVFHCRMAHQEMINIISKFQLQGVIHCFTGTLDDAKKYLEMGFYLGFNGIIFKLNLDNIIKEIPLDKILVETDCPYLTPPAAGIERNEPSFVKYIVQKIAEIKELAYEKVAEDTTQNARNLFKI